MSRNTIIIIGLVVLIVIGGGLAWLLLSSLQNTPSDNNSSQNAQDTPATQTPNTSSGQTGNGEQTAETNSVTIANFAFSPASIQVKKGTTVTWVNQDTTGHNVVASESGNTGGLPTTASLLAKGESFSFTFNQVGTFPYVCEPHASSMKGVVEVVE